MKFQKRVNLQGMRQIKKAFGENVKVKVGVLGDGAQRTDGDNDLNNAEIGMIQELGTADGSIPPRSWLRMPLEHEQAKIVKAVMSKKDAIADALAKGDMTLAPGIAGIAAEAAILRAFSSGGFGQWEPNAPSTIRQKGSSQPLVDTGNLSQNISSEVVKGD